MFVFPTFQLKQRSGQLFTTKRHFTFRFETLLFTTMSFGVNEGQKKSRRAIFERAVLYLDEWRETWIEFWQQQWRNARRCGFLSSNRRALYMDKVNNGHSNWLHPARRSGSREKGVCPPGTTVHTELYGPIVLGLGNSSCSRFQCHSHTVLFMSNIFGGYADRGKKKKQRTGGRGRVCAEKRAPARSC